MKEEMEQGWYLLPNKKIIARKRIPNISFIISWLGFKRTKMVDLYSMTKRAFHSSSNITNMMAFPFPLEHDNFPKPDKYPFYYRVMNGWRIEKESLIFLKDGPLFSENSKNVIVHSKIYVKSLLHHAWSVTKVLAVVIGLLASLKALYGL